MPAILLRPSGRPLLLLLLLAMSASACRAPTIDQRRAERSSAFASLSPEMQSLVNQGQVRAGMPMDAVYIAWGKPDEIVEGQEPGGDVATTWLYRGTWLQEQQSWTYREVVRGNAVFLERFPERDYQPQSYISAEIVFINGVVHRWRTLPRP